MSSSIESPSGRIYYESCFFCNPDITRIITLANDFYVILGLGPIKEGYVILASRQHYRSTFDLPEETLHEFEGLRRRLIQVVKDEYGACVITEHGRISSCTADEDAHEEHCFHAHELLFPVDVHLERTRNDVCESSAEQ